MTRFSEKEIIALFRVTRQRLCYWRKIGLLPRHEPGGPKGYSYHDLLSIKVILNLTSTKIQVRRIKTVLDQLKRMDRGLSNPLLEKSFFVQGKKVIVIHNGKALDIVSQQYMLYQIKDLDKELKTNVIVKNRLKEAKKLDEASNA